MACVESIRAARLKTAERDEDDGSTDCSVDGDDGSTSTATPECLPMAVAAWTQCCEEANLRERGAEKED